MADSPKVYCENCIFFIPGEHIPMDFGPPVTQLEKCISPNNFKDTHVAPHELPISQPKIINQFNNCVWYIAKHGSSSSSSGSNTSSSSSG